MNQPNVSLLYVGEYDGSQVVAGLAETDKAFVKSEETVKKAAHGMAEAEGHHRRIFGLRHQEMRRTLSESSAAYMIFTESLERGSLGARQGIESLSVGMLSFASLGLPTVLMGVGLAVAFIAESIKKSKEAARDTSWYEDPEEIEKTIAAMDDYDKKIKQVNESIGQQATIITGMNTYNAAISNADSAMEKLHHTTMGNYETAHGGATKARALLEMQKNAAHDLVKEMELINDLEAKKSLLQAQGALGAAEAGGDPIAKQKAAGSARVAEAKNAQEILLAQQRVYGDKRLILEAKLQTDIEEKEKDKIRKEQEELTRKYDRLSKEIAVGVEKNKTVEKTAFLESANEIRKIHEEEQARAEAASNEATNKYLDHRRKEREVQKRDADEAKRLLQEEKQWRSELNKQIRDTEMGGGKGGLTTDQARMADEIEAFKASNAAKVANTEETERVINAIKNKYALKEKQLHLQQTSDIISDSEGLVGALSKHNKALFLASKALAAADVVVKTQQALAVNASEFGVYSAAGPDEVTYARMAIQLATIAATTIQGYETGGMIYGRNRLIRTNESGEEAVLNPRGVAAAGGPSGIAALNAGQGGGGMVHLGDTIVQISGDVSNQRAREIGAAVAQSKMDRLIQLKSDLKDIPYLNIPDLARA